MHEAADVFRRAWAESAVGEYYVIVQQDVSECLHRSKKTNSFGPLLDLAKRRYVLVTTILAPTLVLFRFPWLALGVLRAVATVGAFSLEYILRTDPRVRAAILHWLWKQVVAFLRMRN